MNIMKNFWGKNLEDNTNSEAKREITDGENVDTPVNGGNDISGNDDDDTTNFLVRVDFNANFVSEEEARSGEDNTPAVRLLAALSQKSFFVGKRNCACRSFIVFNMSAKNEYECEKLISSIWDELYPDYKNAYQVVAYPEDDSEAAKVLGEIYCAYLGWDEYIAFVTDIAHEMPFVTRAEAKDMFMSQNYLVSMDSGCGFTQLVSSLTDFLDRIGYFDDAAGVYHEYIINEDEDAGDTTTKDLFTYLYDDEDDEMKQQCIGIDLAYYLDKEKHEELRTFLKRLYKLQDRYIFLFRIPYLENKARKEIFDIVSDIVNVKELIFEPYNELILCEMFIDVLLKHGTGCTPDLQELFKERIRLERRDGRFYGFKTVRKVAEEAALLKFKHDSQCKRCGETYDVEVASASDVEELVKGIKRSEKSGYEELHDLIGMEEIETRIREIVAQVKLAKSNDKIDTPCLHMRFTGAPGTGKTTVARIIGKIFREEGILRKGSFFEYAARSLCGKYVGQTAPKTAQICRDAYGSVLFIDEAYALYAGDNETSSNDYGKEAISTLIAEMENHRDDMVVVMAGYTEDMDKLMEANAGLRSRMPYVIEFKSYDREQLAAIFMNYVKKHFTVGEGLEEAVKEYFDSMADSYLQSKEFANARFVRNLYERTWSKAALRISASGTSDIVITVDDFNAAKAEKEFSEKLMIAKVIGF